MRKSIFVFALIIAASFTLKAQSQVEEVELIQSLFGMEKQSAMETFLQLDETNADAFWKLYDQYEAERKQHGLKRIDLLTRYTNEYMDLDEAATESIIDESIALSKAYDKLVVNYYKKIKKVAGVKVASQFYQVEFYLKSYIRTIIFSEIPFVGEID